VCDPKSTNPRIVYTYTDEAPALATYALLPIIHRFARSADIDIDVSDISVAARVLAQFPERLLLSQKQSDTLAELGELVKDPGANVIKLPNVSASIPQLVDCIKELQAKDYDIPDYPADPKTPEEVEIQARYAKVLGSAVNPVLREGNSDRRVAKPVKEYAQANPHRMKLWQSNSPSHVSHMTEGDFYGSEKSATMAEATTLKITLVSNGNTTVLKESTAAEKGEVFDASFISVKKLCEFYEKEIQDAKDKEILFSLHLKATMMKTPPPKDGKPRYIMPEAGYSPAKEAEARFAEKMKAEAAAKASASE
jgi:isocitrate dehydrogenase